jgi:hypothetical protein
VLSSREREREGGERGGRNLYSSTTLLLARRNTWLVGWLVSVSEVDRIWKDCSRFRMWNTVPEFDLRGGGAKMGKTTKTCGTTCVPAEFQPGTYRLCLKFYSLIYLGWLKQVQNLVTYILHTFHPHWAALACRPVEWRAELCLHWRRRVLRVTDWLNFKVRAVLNKTREKNVRIKEHWVRSCNHCCSGKAISIKCPIHSQLNWAILLCNVIPDGKTE